MKMRMYDGCPDSELKSKIASRETAIERLKKAGLTVTYFPVEGRWMAFDENHKPVSDFADNVELLVEKLGFNT